MMMMSDGDDDDDDGGGGGGDEDGEDDNDCNDPGCLASCSLVKVFRPGPCPLAEFDAF